MLNKALLASPKEFKISIGTQTHCSVQLSKISAMPGDKITVTVNPATGYGNITVGISTNGSVTKVNTTTFTFIMPFTDVVVNASASVLSFRITVNKQGSGNVNVKSVANYGEVVTVSFSANQDWKFGSISISGVGLSGSGNGRTFTMPAHDITINVVFSELYPGFTPCTLISGSHYSRPSKTYYYGLVSAYIVGEISPKIISNLYYEDRPGSDSTYIERPFYYEGKLYDRLSPIDEIFYILNSNYSKPIRIYVKSTP